MCSSTGTLILIRLFMAVCSSLAREENPVVRIKLIPNAKAISLIVRLATPPIPLQFHSLVGIFCSATFYSPQMKKKQPTHKNNFKNMRNPKGWFYTSGKFFDFYLYAASLLHNMRNRLFFCSLPISDIFST